MSYLTMPNGIPNFSKAVISFWFRVPAVSMAAVYNNFDVGKETVQVPDGVEEGSYAEYDISPNFNGILPLVTFGPPDIKGHYTHGFWTNFASFTRKTQYQLADCTWHEQFPDEVHNFGDFVDTEGPEFPLDPCSIGLQPWDESHAELRINIQYPDVGTASWIRWCNQNVTCDPIQWNAWDTGLLGVCSDIFRFTDVAPPQVRPPAEPNNALVVHRDYNPFVSTWYAGDSSDIYASGNPESFIVFVGTIEPNTWHHALVSFDLSGSISAEGNQGDFPLETFPVGIITSDCRIWVAIDDINYSGDDFGQYVATYDLDENAVVTANTQRGADTNPLDFIYGPYTIQAQFDINAPKTGYVIEEHHPGFSAPSFSWTPPPIATDGHPFGIPATKPFVDKIYQCEMAEFQMFTDVTLDTNIEANRRAFIDYKRDNDGHPVPDKDGHFTLKPVDMGKAEALLGKRAAIVLHGSSNWKKGNNTGSLGYTIDPDTGKRTVNHAGQFTPTGTINSYEPDPSIPPPAGVTPVEIKVKPKAKAPA